MYCISTRVQVFLDQQPFSIYLFGHEANFHVALFLIYLHNKNKNIHTEDHGVFNYNVVHKTSMLHCFSDAKKTKYDVGFRACSVCDLSNIRHVERYTMQALNKLVRYFISP